MSAELATPAITVIAAVTGVSKTYPGVTALSNVTFSVGRGEVRALLGKNGAGKSTLIRLLAGAEQADSGTVSLNGTLLDKPTVAAAHSLGVRTVYQELSLIPQLSVAENLFMGNWPTQAGRVNYRRMHSESLHALDRIKLSVDPARPVEELSIADQQLVEIARAINDDPALLILDEPTSSLAAAEVDRVLEAVRTIRDSGVAVIYVSHRLDEIRRIADKATIMRDGEVVDTVDVAGVTTARVVEMMVGNLQADAPLVQQTSDVGPSLASVKNLQLGQRLTDVSFDVHAGEVLGIAGVLGSGRTEILQSMAGLRRIDAGEITIGDDRLDGVGLRKAIRLGVGFTPEDRKRDGIIPQLGIDENTVLTNWTSISKFGMTLPAKIAAATARVVETMSVKASSTHSAMDTLSGGNQQKIVIGRWLHAGSRLLLLDEPTRGVDVEAKAQIYELLRKLAGQQKAIVFVSSEMEELNLVCDRVIVLNGGRIVSEFNAPGIKVEDLFATSIAEH